MSDKKCKEGKPKYCDHAKRILHNVLETYRYETEVGDLCVSLDAPAVEQAACYTGLSSFTIYRQVSKKQSRVLKPPGQIGLDIDDFDKCVVRRTVADIITKHRVLPTTQNILKELQSRIVFEGGEHTLRRILKTLGFSWKKCQSNRHILTERKDVVMARIKYLREIKKLREQGMTIVYTDETYVNTSHSTQKCWQSDDIAVNVPFSKGERLIVVHAGSENSFIQGAQLLFKAKSSSGDYHSEMNGQNSVKWLTEKLIPNLPANSVLVVHNAAYHNMQEDRCPTQAARKLHIQEWLSRKEIAYTADMLKVEILDLCKRNKPKPKYIINVLLARHGHKCVRLPPYHADLNPIELIWVKVKGKVARGNLVFKFKVIQTLTENALDAITAEEWMSCCQHVKKIEQKYRASDIAVEEQIEKFVIQITSSDEDTDTASELDVETDTATEGDEETESASE